MKHCNEVKASARAFFCAALLGVFSSQAIAQTVGVNDFAPATFTDTNEFQLPYRLFIPPVYNQKPGQTFPLILFLHGAGQTGTDNRGQFGIASPFLFAQPQQQAANPCFMVAPQYPPSAPWANVPLYSQNYSVTNTSESLSLLAAVDLVKSLRQQYRIDPSRVYVTGLSMGAIGAWDAIVRHPGVFAAAVPISGCGDPSQAIVIKNLPVWAFHNDLDTTCPSAGSASMIAALKAVGNQNALLTIYPAMGHDAWDAAYATPELPGWLFAQALPPMVATVAGTLTFEGIVSGASPRSVVFDFRDGNGATAFSRTAAVASGGSYSFGDIPTGNYTVHVKANGYLAANIAVNNVNGAVSNADAALPAGDANNDNSVDSTDFGLLIGAFGSDARIGGSGYDPAADFNGDGFVDSTDFGLLIGEFGSVGVQ